MMDPDLYAVLPPNKKEEYKKMFPMPVYIKTHRVDQSGYVWIDRELLIIPESSGYISNIKSDIIGTMADLPECPGCVGASTQFCDYGNVHEEQRLIKYTKRRTAIDSKNDHCSDIKLLSSLPEFGSKYSMYNQKYVCHGLNGEEWLSGARPLPFWGV